MFWDGWVFPSLWERIINVHIWTLCFPGTRNTLLQLLLFSRKERGRTGLFWSRKDRQSRGQAEVQGPLLPSPQLPFPVLDHAPEALLPFVPISQWGQQEAVLLSQSLPGGSQRYKASRAVPDVQTAGYLFLCRTTLPWTFWGHFLCYMWLVSYYPDDHGCRESLFIWNVKAMGIFRKLPIS